MSERLSAIREVSLLADQANFTEKAQELGRQAAQSLGKDHRAQITGLESMVNSAIKVSDVRDFIKTRVARHSDWRPWGSDLLDYLGNRLQAEARSICQKPGIGDDPMNRQWVHLLLIREFVHQLAAHYEYSCEME